MTDNEIGKTVVDAAVTVHRALGPGLLESVYEVILAQELQRRGLVVERQVPIPIEYDGVKFDEGFRADIMVAGRVVIELKSVEHTSAAHRKQIQTYLHLTGCKLGSRSNASNGRAGETRAARDRRSGCITP
jgi:GxxExxY protein